MIIQVGQLFINTETITTISPYEHVGDKDTESGVVINGIKYAIFLNKNGAKEIHDANAKVASIINTIINLIIKPNPVQKLNLEDEDAK